MNATETVEKLSWAKANPERHRENVRRWKAKNPGKVAEYSRAARLRNPARYKAMQKEWRDKNPDKVKATQRRQYERIVNNPELLAKKRAHTESWKARNREKIKHDQRIHGPRYQMMYMYGITLAQYEKLKKAQGNRCAACGQKGSSINKLCVDHNHETEKVRGLLCRKCNSALGLLQEDIRTINNLLAYLTKHEMGENQQTQNQ